MGGLARRCEKHTPFPNSFFRCARASSSADHRIMDIRDTCQESGVRDAHRSGYACEGDQSWKIPHGDELNVYETEEKYTTPDPDHTSVEDNTRRSVEMSHNDSEKMDAPKNTNPRGSTATLGQFA